MKVAYIFAANMACTFKLATMILPQLEQGNHGAQVIGMMFFDDNIFCLCKGDAVGERLAKIAKAQNILIKSSRCELANEHPNFTKSEKRREKEKYRALLFQKYRTSIGQAYDFDRTVRIDSERG